MGSHDEPDEGESFGPADDEGPPTDENDPSPVDDRDQPTPVDEGQAAPTGDGNSSADTASGIVSVKHLALVAGMIGLGMAVGGAYLPFGHPAGVFVGAFAAGLVSERSPILEAAVVGFCVGAIEAFLTNSLLLSILGFGSYLVLVGGVVGLVLGAVGAYLGYDLRDGITRDLDAD